MKLPNTGKPATPTNNRAAAKLRISLGLAAAGGSLAAGLCIGAAKADTTINTINPTINPWNGSSFIGSWGGTVTPTNANSYTYGQTFTAPSASSLKSFTFNTRSSSIGSQPYTAYLYQLNTNTVQGPAIWTRAGLTLSGNTSSSSTTLNINSAKLQAGTRYVFFLTTAGLNTSGNPTYEYGTVSGASNYTGGQFIFSKNDDFTAALDLGYGGTDLAFLMIFGSSGLGNPSTLQPYASNQSIGLDALKNQRDLVLNEAGECDRRGWVVYDSDKNQPQAKTKKHQSLCIFAEGGNANGTINGTGSLGGYNTANASSAFGLEWKASKQWTIGAAYGYGSTNLSNFNFQDTSASIGSTINSGALYGVYRPDKQQRWKLAGLFGYSGFSYTGSRSYLGDVATSAYNSSGYTGALQASYDIPLTTDYNGEKNRLSPIRIKPMLGLAYGSQQQDGFSESGAGTLVNVQGQTTNSLLGSVGVSLEAPIALNLKKTTVLIPRIGVAYQYDFLADQDGNRSITASLQDDATTSYTVQGQNRGSSNLQLNLGADLQLNPKTVLYAGVNYQAFNTGDQFGYQGGLRYKF